MIDFQAFMVRYIRAASGHDKHYNNNLESADNLLPNKEGIVDGFNLSGLDESFYLSTANDMYQLPKSYYFIESLVLYNTYSCLGKG